jgi:hypothetical protein
VVVKQGEAPGEGSTLVIPLPELGQHIEVPMPPAPPAPPAAPEAPASGERGEPGAAGARGDDRESSGGLEAMLEAAAEAKAAAAERRQDAEAERREAAAERDAERGGARAAWKECRPGAAEQTFASAWSPELRRQLLTELGERRGATLVAAMALLDRVRQEWLRAHGQACEQPARAAFETRRACLLELRDEVRSGVKALRRAGGELGEVDFASLAAVVASTAMCVGDDDERGRGGADPR